VPTNTFFATATAVVSNGATPVFADVDDATLLLAAEGVRQQLTRRTAAVIVVHLYGQPVNMTAISKVAAEAGIVLIEDAAQAHGATWRGQRAGGLSRAGCFSFYPSKNLGAFGDAGAVVTNDAALGEKIRSLANYGRRTGDPYRHDCIAGNHRLDALQAAILSAKLKRLDAWNAARRRVAQRYAAGVAGLPLRLVEEDPDARGVYHQMIVRTTERAELQRALAEEGISTGIHYPTPCHRQTPFLSAVTPRLRVAEAAAQEILSLPMFPHLSEAQIDHVVRALHRACEANTVEAEHGIGARPVGIL
jgi:dTDP-4-amino-4,6-dideoxygalactose transaminase